MTSNGDHKRKTKPTTQKCNFMTEPSKCNKKPIYRPQKKRRNNGKIKRVR